MPWEWIKQRFYSFLVHCMNQKRNIKHKTFAITLTINFSIVIFSIYFIPNIPIVGTICSDLDLLKTIGNQKEF